MNTENSDILFLSCTDFRLLHSSVVGVFGRSPSVSVHILQDYKPRPLLHVAPTTNTVKVKENDLNSHWSWERCVF